MKPANDPITELRLAIDQLPVTTRTAMLDGIRTRPIIVGAYTDGRGGICPMLAAHRNGGRTTLLAFAKSWDGFAKPTNIRRATRRELKVLELHLTESLLAEGATVPAEGFSTSDSDLGAAIADHVALKQRHEEEQEAERQRVPEEQIRATRLSPGRLRLRRVEADAERALARLDEHVLAATR